MRVAILEDEPLAADKLQRYLGQYDSSIEVLNIMNSITSAVQWIEEHRDHVDLYFMDVQLIDGLSFELFSRTTVNKPIIFTTAFDEFAIDAFKVNSIDYLLKPISFTALSRALKKFESLKLQFGNFKKVEPIMKTLIKKAYKDRFLVKIGNHIKSIATSDITAFGAEGRDVFLYIKTGKAYLTEYTLEELEAMLNPKQFFRVNRSFMVSLNTIDDVTLFSNRRLKLLLKPDIHKEIVVSREKVARFKLWLEGN